MSALLFIWVVYPKFESQCQQRGICGEQCLILSVRVFPIRRPLSLSCHLIYHSFFSFPPNANNGWKKDRLLDSTCV